MFRFLRRLIDEINDDGVFDSAASVAFWLILSLPAALLTALSTVSLLGDDAATSLQTTALEFADDLFGERADALTAPINELFDQTRPGVLSASIAIALFTVSRGFAGLIRALDTVYDVRSSRNFIQTRVLAVGLAIGTLAVVSAAVALWNWSASNDVAVPLRLLMGEGLLVVWASMLYHFAPNQHSPWRYDLPGAILTAIGWIVLSIGFGWYVSIVGDGNQFVGVTGAVLLALTWLWGACVVFLIGGEINQLIAERAGVITHRPSIYSRARSAARRRRVDGDDTADDATSDDTATPDTATHDTATDAGAPRRPSAGPPLESPAGAGD